MIFSHISLRCSMFFAVCILGPGDVWSGDSHKGQPIDLENIMAPLSPKNGAPSVVGAEKADPAKWPATRKFDKGNLKCTSTIIGKRVLLTAAHCLTPGKIYEISLPNSVTKVKTLGCTWHVHYDGKNSPPAEENKTKDFALCMTNADMNGFPYERVSTSIVDHRVNEDISLLGYGCTERGGFYGHLYTAPSRVIRKPASPNDLDTITKDNTALCKGDSGGAGYVKRGANGFRVIIGVNSRGDQEEYSYLSSTNTESFVNWALDWADNPKKLDVSGKEICIFDSELCNKKREEENRPEIKICGLHPEAKSCRSW